MESNLKYDVDIKEAAKFVAIMYTSEDIRSMKIVNSLLVRDVEIEGMTGSRPTIAFLDSDTYVKTRQTIKETANK